MLTKFELKREAPVYGADNSLVLGAGTKSKLLSVVFKVCHVDMKDPLKFSRQLILVHRYCSADFSITINGVYLELSAVTAIQYEKQSESLSPARCIASTKLNITKADFSFLTT